MFHKNLDKLSGHEENVILISYVVVACCLFAVPPNILDIESTPSSVAVRENQNINMTCRADGFPAPKIIWRREDGEEIAVEKKKKGNLKIISFVEENKKKVNNVYIKKIFFVFF